jgi:hypothetical protein
VAINETVTRTYCGVPRENNHLNGSTSGSIVPGPPYDLNKLDCYWDQATGILTEELLECSTQGLSSSLSIHFKILDTNLWEAPVIFPVVDTAPDVLNLGGKGKWITAYIELPEGFEIGDIDLTTVVLNGTVPAELHLSGVGDYDGDTTPDLMVEFNRTEAAELILSKGIMTGNVTLAVSGQLIDGTLFEGCDIIMVRMPGDVNVDGKVNLKDIMLAIKSFGSFPGHPRWNPMVDENEDNKINIIDVLLIMKNFGKKYT